MPGADALHAQFRAALGVQGDGDVDALLRAIAEAVRSHQARATLPAEVAVPLGALEDDLLAHRAPGATTVDAFLEAAWRRLEGKHTNSTTIEDAEDRLLRGALALGLAAPASGHDVGDTIGWAAEMLSDEPWPRPMRHF